MSTAAKAETTPAFSDITDFRQVMKELEIAEPNVTAVPHLWKWDYIHHKLTGADAFDLNEVHRRAFALCNPGLGGRPFVARTLFASMSIYLPGDKAPVHRHTPSASRFSLEGTSGYTNVAGELLRMGRGDLVITPNGEWHDHGNDGEEPVIWIDVLDAPLVEYLNAAMTEWDYSEQPEGSNSAKPVGTRTQSVFRPKDYSQKLFGAPGVKPLVGGKNRMGRNFTPKFLYKAEEARAAQDMLRDEADDPYEGVLIEYIDPTTGESVVPTLSFRSSLLRPGERTLPKRQSASAVFCVLEGNGVTHAGDRTFEWGRNDVFVIPGWFWFHHENTSQSDDAVLYHVTDQPALEKLGVYRSQGKTLDGGIVDISRWPDFD